MENEAMAIDYEPLDMAEIKTEAERVNSDPTTQTNDDFLQKFVRIPEGEGYVVMRFLPRNKGKKLYCATKTHRLKGTDGKSRSYHSPKELVMTERGPKWQGESTIDRYLRDLWQRSEKATGKQQDELRNQYRQIKGFDRYYYNVIVREEKDPKTGNITKNAGPKIYSCGKTVHAMIMRAISGDESAGLKALGDITHPTNGRDFRLVKKITKGSGGDYPNYDLSQFEEPSPLGTPEEMETWMDNLHDLEALRVVKTDDELKHALKVHLGIIKDDAPGGDSDFDPTEFQVPKTQSSAAAAAEETVRDELTSSVTEEQVVEAKAEEEEVLADDEFMKELEGM
jgi:hypothetical protein